LYFTYFTLFTVGYGDVHAYNTGERFYIIVLSFSSVVAFATIIARVKMVVDSQNLMARDLRAKMEDFKEYLAEKGVPHGMKVKLKDAYAYYIEMVPSLEEGGFYDELPKTIRNSFVRNKFAAQIYTIRLFREADVDFVAQVRACVGALSRHLRSCRGTCPRPPSCPLIRPLLTALAIRPPACPCMRPHR